MTAIKNKQTRSFSTAFAHFQWWLSGGHPKQVTTIENEQTCSFLKVVGWW